MVGTRTLARLLDAADQTSTKLVLVGDHHQLPEIDAGGAFAGLVNRLPAIELTDNRRQQARWETRSTSSATATSHKRSRPTSVTDGSRSPTPPTGCVSSWSPTGGTRSPNMDTAAVMVAARGADIDDLNQRARTRMAADDRLTGRPLEVWTSPRRPAPRLCGHR